MARQAPKEKSKRDSGVGRPRERWLGGGLLKFSPSPHVLLVTHGFCFSQ